MSLAGMVSLFFLAVLVVSLLLPCDEGSKFSAVLDVVSGVAFAAWLLSVGVFFLDDTAMSSEQTLTLAQARAEIERFHQVNLDEQAVCPKETLERAYYNGAVDMGKESIAVLARVQEPSEDDRAALWLMKEMCWKLSYSQVSLTWSKIHFLFLDGDREYEKISPAEEARKLGWEG